MNCPYCGMKVKDLSNYCPASGNELPIRTRDGRNDITYRRLSNVTLISAFVCPLMGLSLSLPEVIIAYIGGLDGRTLCWPNQAYLLVVGVVLLVVRYPIARRSARATIQMMHEADKILVSSYCGEDNMPGSRECESCGAPIK